MKHNSVLLDSAGTLSAHPGRPTICVDFLGQNLACYFMQLTESQRGIEGSAEQAFGKLYELQTLRRFVGQRPKVIDLLPEERPGAFELAS